MLKLDQVDLSALFPEPSIADGPQNNSVPVFLVGEKRQAVYTSTHIPQVKTVEKVSRECSSVRLRDYLYVIVLCVTMWNLYSKGPNI